MSRGTHDVALRDFVHSLRDQMADSEHVAISYGGSMATIHVHDAEVLVIERRRQDDFFAESKQCSPVCSWAVLGPNDSLRAASIAGMVAYLERRLAEASGRRS